MTMLLLMEALVKAVTKKHQAKKLHFPTNYNYKFGICSQTDLHLLKLSWKLWIWKRVKAADITCPEEIVHILRMSRWTSLDRVSHPFFPEPSSWTTRMIPKLFYETPSGIAFISQNSRVLILLDLYKQHLTELIIPSAFLHLTSGHLTSLFFPNSQLHLMFLLSFPNSTLLSMSWDHFVTISFLLRWLRQ